MSLQTRVKRAEAALSVHPSPVPEAQWEEYLLFTLGWFEPARRPSLEAALRQVPRSHTKIDLVRATIAWLPPEERQGLINALRRVVDEAKEARCA